MWLDLVVALSSCAAGLTGGWVIRTLHVTAADRRRRGTTDSDQAATTTLTQHQVAAIASRLQASACTMAADVDAHRSKVEQVSDCLHHQDEVQASATVVDAVEQLISANEEMKSQLHEAQERIREQTIQIESAEQRALTDALTHVFNRRAFDEYLTEQESLGPPKAGTLVLLDIDHFKHLNDVHGHRAGDEVLGVVGGILAARLAAAGMVARFGGEEFAVVLNERPVRQCIDLVEDVRRTIGERDIIFDGDSLHVTICVGMAELMPDEKASSWLQRADEALYRSKNAGRNCGHWMNENVPIRMEPSGIGDAEISARPGEGKSTQTATGRARSTGGSTSQVEPATQWSAAPRPAASLQRTGEHSPASDPTFPVDQQSRALRERAGALREADWAATFEQIRTRAEAVGRSIFLMVVRFNGEETGGVMRSLLQLVRAGARNVDRIGCEDVNTLVLCMPSVDEEIALERANQICRAAEAMKLGGEMAGEFHRVSIAISPVLPEETFGPLVQRVREAACEASHRENEPVAMCVHEAVGDADPVE